MKRITWVFAALATIGYCHSARADEPTTPSYAQRILEGKTPVEPQSPIQQAGCSSCGGGISAITSSIGGGGGCGCGNEEQECGNGCPTGKCKPGRRCGTCYGDFERPDECTGKCSRLFGGIFDCLCCPDPCYEPCWRPVANSAFFTDAARPRSTMMLRYDAGMNFTMPDRNEYFWARTGTGGKGPPAVESRLNYQELRLYTEAGNGGFSAIFEMPYRVVDPSVNPYDAGWADLMIGTKALMVDCELMQIAFEFKTFIPTGSSRQGFGTGHVSLEPSLLGTLKIAPKTYLQTQISEWIPIGGDNDFAGCILHYHTSLNHVLCCKGAFQLVGTSEFFGYTFQDGLTHNPPGLGLPDVVKSSGESIWYVGPGLRLFYCDKYDVGFSAAFSVSDDHFADQLYRLEFRYRF